MDMKLIGDFIRQKIKEKGITQEVLAQELGITASAVSQALSGKNTFDIVNLQMISQLLDIPLDLIVSGGEERITKLETLATKTPEELKKTNQDLGFIKEIDSKQKTVFDYAIKHRNIPLLHILVQYGLLEKVRKNLSFMTMLVQEKEKTLLKKLVDARYTNVPRLGNEISDEKEFESRYIKLTSEEKDFLEACVLANDDEVMQLFNLINKPSNANYMTPILLLGIKLDNEKFVDKIESSYDITVQQTKYILQRRYEKLLKYAISNKCIQVSKYYYDLIEQFHIKDVFDELILTKDKEYITDIFKQFVTKTRNHYEAQTISTKICSVGLIEKLIKENNTELLDIVYDYCDQTTLDQGLKFVNVNQVDIIKKLLQHGAIFKIFDSGSGNVFSLDAITAIIYYLLTKIDS